MSDAARAKEVDGVDRTKEAADYLDTCFGVGTLGRVHVARLREATEQGTALRVALTILVGMYRNKTLDRCSQCGHDWDKVHATWCVIGRFAALLADPEGQGCKCSPGNAPSQFCREHGEGQRAGEEWRALRELESLIREYHDQGHDPRCKTCYALAAVDRVRQP